ncbi:hypothetical protein AYI70_g10480 [Smittium culicis]|uniref:Uncharacterized protein n=1 Tax=Smittium culicis TaxID=133412 RepID=A0A1R1X6C5_9FUNG|nr:hypothetical protein AYI70_g10480 [Smittium culicis]
MQFKAPRKIEGVDTTDIAEKYENGKISKHEISLERKDFVDTNINIEISKDDDTKKSEVYGMNLKKDRVSSLGSTLTARKTEMSKSSGQNHDYIMPKNVNDEIDDIIDISDINDYYPSSMQKIKIEQRANLRGEDHSGDTEPEALSSDTYPYSEDEGCLDVDINELF